MRDRWPLLDGGVYGPAVASALPGRSLATAAGELVRVLAAEVDPDDARYLLLDVTPAPAYPVQDVTCRYCGALLTASRRSGPSAWAAMGGADCDVRAPGHAPLTDIRGGPLRPAR